MLTAVSGIRVGHYTDLENITGCTVVLAPPEGAVGGVDVRGPAPGTRETELLRTGHLVERAHAVLLTGGSAFGLDAAAGVMRFLEEQHIGFDVGTLSRKMPLQAEVRDSVSVGVVRVPIVPAAVLFDLDIGSARVRPDAQAGYAACLNAHSGAFEEGSVGAGTGATVGKFYGTLYASKGGIGSAACRIGDDDHPITVAALVAVNAWGDVVDSTSGMIIAGARNPHGAGWLDTARALREGSRGGSAETFPLLAPFHSTTIGVIATDATLNPEEANIVAMMAHNGIARVIRPAHSMLDGDTLFVLATGHVERGQGAKSELSATAARSRELTAIGHAAAEMVAQAIVRGVKAARGLGGVKAWNEE